MRKATNKNWQRVTAAAAALALCAGVLTGCGASSSTAAGSTAASSAASEVSSEEADEMAAKNVADLIDAIYVQERNENTDAQCEAAKAAWDALTDAQKEMVEGEEADPDYFGRDTGDASKDDARNQDNIGDNEILVVSFGTSFNNSRAADIKGIEDAIQAAYPDWSVRRAFTAQIIINHVQARDGEKIDNMEQALERAVANGVKNLVVQPTHLMHGAEYDEMMEMVDSYRDKFESVAVAEPLLGEVGSDATVINADKEAVAKAITAEAVKTAGFDSLDAAAEDGTAFVFMGHGTSHTAKVSYTQMQSQMNALGYKNVFIGTVTYSDGLSDEVYGFDIPVKALDEDFQLAILGSKGKWYDHTVRVANAQPAAAEAPADGTYTCDVTLEGGSGRATVDSPAALTVTDGRMTATIVWSSPNYDYMLVDGEKYLPTNTEGNSTFEIPVAALDTPLDVVGDTVAMSTPHEIEYTLTFASASLTEAK